MEGGSMSVITRPFAVTRRGVLRLLAFAASFPAVNRLARAAGAVLASRTWDELRGAVTGKVVVAGDDGYESLRREMIWNGRKPDGRPAAVVRAGSEADVVAAVRYARTHGLKMSARGGGHHWSAPAMRDGVLMVDLSAMRKVDVDVTAKTARVGPGVTGGELARTLAGSGLAFPVGHCPTVPLSGYLLGGGIGWNSGSWGPACLSVTGIDLVTAGGEVIRADADRHADYFWAARGGGPGFPGIATRYHLMLHDLPPAIYSSNLVYPVEAAATVARWLLELSAALGRNVELICLQVSPPGATDARKRVLVVGATAFEDSEAEARRALAPVADAPEGAVHAEHHVHTPMDALFESMGNAFPVGHRYAADALWVDAEPAKYLGKLCAPDLVPPSPRSMVLVAIPPAPEPGATPPDMAFSMSARAFVGAYSVWQDVEADAENVAWVRAVGRQLGPVTAGYYVGEVEFGRSGDRARRCFAPGAWEKLQALRRRHDPDGLFTYFP